MNDRSSHNGLSFPQRCIGSLAPGYKLRILLRGDAVPQAIDIGEGVGIDNWRSPALLNRPDRTDGLILCIEPRRLHLRKDTVQLGDHSINCVQLLLDSYLVPGDGIPASRISNHQFYNTSLACDSSTTGQGSSSQAGKLSKQAWLSIEKLVEVVVPGTMIPIEIANCGHLQASSNALLQSSSASSSV